MDGNKSVSVAVRVRPVLREGASQAHIQEKFELEAVRRTGDTTLKVELQRPGEPTRSSAFTFDYIFDQESTQLEVYEESVVDLVDAALAGVNATILTYGQTGSGKTFTVLGDVKPNPLENDLLTHNSGMFLRVLSDLMDYKIRKAKNGFHVVVGLSCVEIYNESIRDLFGGKAGDIPPSLKAVLVGDDVLLPSLIIKEMTSLQAVFSEIQLAISRRKSRSTDANMQSSRSHCLFFIDILQQADTAPPPSLGILETKKGNMKDAKEAKRVLSTGTKPGELAFDGMVYRIPGQREPIYGSKILLADLAGSEKINRSGVSGEGLAEATSINSSLTALGNVVHSLHQGGYVSYRTSNLTRLLKSTFSHPNSRVLLLSQVSPTQYTFEETISTLHFANKVKALKVTTTTGGEAEKFQFDYLDSEKTYDMLLADLHIFETETESKSAVIRRCCRPNDGLYYAAAAASREKFSARDRRPLLERLGALRRAVAERDALTERRAAAAAAAGATRRRRAAEAAAAAALRQRRRQAHRQREARDALRAEEALTRAAIADEEAQAAAQITPPRPEAPAPAKAAKKGTERSGTGRVRRAATEKKRLRSPRGAAPRGSYPPTGAAQWTRYDRLPLSAVARAPAPDSPSPRAPALWHSQKSTVQRPRPTTVVQKDTWGGKSEDIFADMFPF